DHAKRKVRQAHLCSEHKPAHHTSFESSPLSLLSLMLPIYRPTCIHELIFNECTAALQLIQQKDALHSLTGNRIHLGETRTITRTPLYPSTLAVDQSTFYTHGLLPMLPGATPSSPPASLPASDSCVQPLCGGTDRLLNAPPTLCHFIGSIRRDRGITQFLVVELIMQRLSAAPDTNL
ncbi:Hypothetical predicted protein, partial [Scomber scombrus]